MSEDAMNDLASFLDNVDESGVHKARVQNIRYSPGRDGRNWVIFKFLVSDAGNPIDGAEFERWIRDYSHLSMSDYNMLTGEEKRDVRRSNQLLLSTLMEIGLSEDDAKEVRSNPKSETRKQLIGELVWIEVSVTASSGRVYKNIRKIQKFVEDIDLTSDIPF
jgi:hypothetical protein